MGKRILALVMTLVLIMTMLPIPAIAAETVTLASVNDKLANLRSKLCTGSVKYWNAGYSKSKMKTVVDNGILDLSNPTNSQLGVTTSACGSSCGSNQYDGTQCYGFARWVQYVLFGCSDTDSSNFNTYAITSGNASTFTLQPGDLLQVGYGTVHSAIIASVNGNTFTCLEAWGSSGCQINYSSNGFNSYYNTLSKVLAKYPGYDVNVYRYKSVDGNNTGTDTVRPENIVDMGDDFYSAITHMSSQHYLCNVDGNVELGDEYVTGALWHFIKQSDGSYKILNGVDGKALDVYNNDTENGTNIQVYAENDTTAQRWYIVKAPECYSLISAESGKALDIENNSAEVGANAQLYTANGTDAQVLYFASRPDYAHGVTADRRTVSLSMEYDRIQTVLFTVYGEFEGTYAVDFSCDSSVISCSWQEWDGMSIPLKITANKAGTDTITVSLRYAGSEDVLSSTTIEVTVASDSADDEPTTPPVEENSGTCGENLTWVLDSDGTLTISGTGNMTDYGNTDNIIPWIDYHDTISSVVIEEGVTSISDAAFLACTNLINVTIPKSVTSIGETAFSACSSLTGIYVDTNNPKYSNDEYGVLFNKDKTILLRVPGTITSYHIPEGVISIGDSAFNDCSNLTSITIPTSVTSIGDFAFHLCVYLTDVYYGGSETQWNAITIGEYNYLDRATIHFTYTPPAEDDKPVTPPVSGNPFVDVAKDAYYFEPVQWAVKNGITNGMDATHFAPDGTCTRAQIVTFLWRANGSPAPTSYHSPFTDVPSGQWYTAAVLWAVEKGITTGTSATTFSPDDGCTRGQVATFLWRSQTTPASVMPANSFTDIDSNAYYYNAVLWAVENGITNGTSATTFSPDATCTRGQIVTFLYRNDSVRQYINRYTYHCEDVSWTEANERAKALGGHLVHLDSIGEMGYLMARIYEMDYESSCYILLGGRRDLDEQVYFWRDTDGNKVGGSLNSESSWENALWLMGEPSLGYAGEWENVMAMQYSDKDGRWGWNDVPDDLPNTILRNDPSKLGTIVYIVEYED